MLDYTGMECPVCKKKFTEQDEDIVVCPECGAPHHRACYQAHGRCGCAEQHGTDQAWDQRQKEQEGTISCPFCGKRIPDSALYCSYCGRSVSQYQQAPGQQQAPGGYPPGGNPQQGQPFYGAPPAGPYRTVDPLCGHAPTEEFEGVQAQNLIKVIRTNTRKYLTVFSSIRDYGRSRFSLPALLFGGAWMLYRKQYRLGGIFTGISAALYAISIVMNILFTTPILTQIYARLGVSGTAGYDFSLANQMASELLANYGALQILLFFIPVLISAIQLALHIFIAVKANRWYYAHCTSTAREIAQLGSVVEQEEAYRRRGGTSIVLFFGIWALYMLASYLPSLI